MRSFHGPAAVWEEPHFTVSLGNREDEMPQIPESEDLPLHEYYTRLRSMIRCKDIGLMEGLFLHPAVKGSFLLPDYERRRKK